MNPIWAPEHSHIPVSRKSPWPGGAELPKAYYDVMDPFVALAAMSSVTKKLKLATGICLVVQRDPIQTAKEICTWIRFREGGFCLASGRDGMPRKWLIMAPNSTNAWM